MAPAAALEHAGGWWWILSALLAFGGIFYYAEGRGLSFFYDEWAFLLTRRANSLDAYFAPHNGHLVVVPVLIYKALWSLFGMRHYGPYRLVDVAMHLTCVALLYVLLHRRVTPALALLGASLLLFLGRAWQVLLWPFQITFLGSAVGGLAALAALDRRGRAADVAVCLGLTLAVCSSGVGIPFWGGAVLAVFLQPRRPARSRVVALAVPIVAYAAWYVRYGGTERLELSNVSTVPRYVLDALGAAGAAATGTSAAHAHAIAVALLVLSAVAVALRRRAVLPAVVPAATLLAFWVLGAHARRVRGPRSKPVSLPGRPPAPPCCRRAAARAAPTTLAAAHRGASRRARDRAEPRHAAGGQERAPVDCDDRRRRAGGARARPLVGPRHGGRRSAARPPGRDG
jgi:hypothetical protein